MNQGMDFPESNSYNSLMKNSSSSFEIRLFYVRISPCVVEGAPESLTLRHLRRDSAFSLLEINGSRVSAVAASASVAIRRDRLDRESSEVTYVSTDSVRVTGGAEFEVLDEGGRMILCGSLERMESPWVGSGNAAAENDFKSGWSLECYIAASMEEGNSSVFQPKLGISSPSIEVYIAGCSGGAPLILTKTISVSPRRKPPRNVTLDAIPEDNELDKEEDACTLGIRYRRVNPPESETDEYEMEGKFGSRYYSEDLYYGEDGQLSWFNAGVRVGVGIGLGMCLGIGIGVGLLMRSYQATTRNFRRRFF